MTKEDEEENKCAEVDNVILCQWSGVRDTEYD